jgi:RNA polymerase-binding transcription factor DksA
MSEYKQIADQLKARLDDLIARTEVIEDDLRGALDADWSEQAVDLADDETLEGVDDVLHQEIAQIRLALTRIDNGIYGECSNCGAEISKERLAARPIATTCIKCA